MICGLRARRGLTVSLEGGVLEVTLTRPDKRNALSDDMVAGLIEVLRAAELDDAVGVVVLGANGEHFCTGFDIVSRNAEKGPRPRVGSIQRRLPSTAHLLIPTMLSVGIPVLCRAQGWAAGIGLHLVMASDLAVVADDASLWEPFSARGLTADSGTSWMLARRVGEVRARQMLHLGRALSGQEAAAWGLVHLSVPADRLHEAVADLASRLAGTPKGLLADTKALGHYAAQHPLDDVVWAEALVGRAAVGARDGHA